VRPFSTLGWPQQTRELEVYYPTSVLVTAHEILFFWVARMIMMGLKFRENVPFSDVYIHAMVFDEHTKKKMSKSLGNVIDPLEMIEKYGADALRMTLCAYAIKGKNLYLSEERFVGYRNFMNKVWNAARFVLSNTEDLAPKDLSKGLNPDLLSLHDRWILSVFARTSTEIDAAFKDYSFDQLVSILYHFVWHQYCDWYLELCKPDLYSKNKADFDENAREKRINTQRILIFLLEGILRLLHPVIPFITEELWQKIRDRYSNERFSKGEIPDAEAGLFFEALPHTTIMTAPWKPVIGEKYLDSNAEKAQQLLCEVIYTVRNIRGEMKIQPGTPTDVFITGGEKGSMEVLKENQYQLDALLNTKNLGFGKPVPKEAFASTGIVQDLTIHVVLPENMHEEEVQRLKKELEKTEKELLGLEKKMGNENFVNKAPKQVVEKAMEKLHHARHEKKRISEQLSRLSKRS